MTPPASAHRGIAAAGRLANRPALVYAIKLLALALTYLVTAKAGLELAHENSSVTAVWAPSGIALAALILWGRGLWPGVALGAFLANAWTGVPLSTELGITAGNTLAAVVGATLLLRVGDFRPSLERARDVLALAVLAAGLSTIVSSTFGVISLYAGDNLATGTALSTWQTWWLGDAAGVLLVAPFLMVWMTALRARYRPRRLLEAAGLLATLVAVSWFVFSAPAAHTFLVFPVLVWAALRFGQRAITAASLILAGIAVGLTANGSGPFAAEPPDVALLDAQLFVGISAFVALLLAAVVAERRQAEAELGSAYDGLETDVLARTVALSGSQALLAEAHQIAELGVWEWDLEDDSMSWSEEMHRIHDVSPDEFEPSFAGCLEKVHPDDRARVEATIRAAHANRRPFALDHRVVRPDGDVRWLETRGNVFGDEAGRPPRMRGVCRDRTERERTKQALRRAEERARRVIEDAHDAFVSIDDAGRILDWNPQAEATFGWSRAEAIGRGLAETIIPERYRVAHRGGLERFLATGEGRVIGTRLELEALHRRGHEFPVELSISAVRTEDGYIFNALLHDISARKRAERTIQEAEERFRAAFDGSPIGMAVMDVRGRFFRVNAALCELTGHSREQLETAGIEAVTDPDDLGEVRGQLELMASGEPSSYKAERRLVRESGQPLWVSLRATLLDVVSGDPARFLAQIIDISDHRRAHEELQLLADTDPLTGLSNRRRFERELESHLERGRRYGMRGAALVLDLDRLKEVNDSLGHNAGDELIVCVARVLGDRVRDTDVVARLGGDEFAVLLPNASVEGARTLAGDLAAAVRKQKAETPDGGFHPVSASVGVTMIDEEEMTGEDVIARADQAMYDAKRAGRDRVAFSRQAPAPVA